MDNTSPYCYNCGKYFLLAVCYKVCSYNNIVLGEVEYTCRKVSAYRKKVKGKANRIPVQVECNTITA